MIAALVPIIHTCSPSCWLQQNQQRTGAEGTCEAACLFRDMLICFVFVWLRSEAVCQWSLTEATSTVFHRATEGEGEGGEAGGGSKGEGELATVIDDFDTIQRPPNSIRGHYYILSSLIRHRAYHSGVRQTTTAHVFEPLCQCDLVHRTNNWFVSLLGSVSPLDNTQQD